MTRNGNIRLAHLAERLYCEQKVTGSTPVSRNPFRGRSRLVSAPEPSPRRSMAEHLTCSGMDCRGFESRRGCVVNENAAVFATDNEDIDIAIWAQVDETMYRLAGMTV